MEIARRQHESGITCDGMSDEPQPARAHTASSADTGMPSAAPRPSDHDATCLICRLNDGSDTTPHGLLYQDDLWVVRHMPPPYAVAGWLILQTRRHCPEPAQFNDKEAVSFGPVLRLCEAALLRVTGAARIYTAALGESHHITDFAGLLVMWLIGRETRPAVALA